MFCVMLNRSVDVPEWLSGMTRNHVGFARAGSNPAVHAFFFFSNIFSLGTTIFTHVILNPPAFP